jgi:hypothetical protein
VVVGLRLRPQNWLDQKNFQPGYQAQPVQDVVAARLWLDRKHDDEELNSGNLVVIGAGQGASIGALWMASEFHRCVGILKGKPSLTPEGRDLAAAVWLGSNFDLGKGAPAAEHLLLKARDVPMAFVHSEEDVPTRNRADALVRRLHGEGKELLIESRSVPGAAFGQGLLRSEKVEAEIQGFLDETLKRREFRDHVPRQVVRNGAFWIFPSGGLVQAKAAGTTIPLHLPVERFR